MVYWRFKDLFCLRLPWSSRQAACPYTLTHNHRGGWCRCRSWTTWSGGWSSCTGHPSLNHSACCDGNDRCATATATGTLCRWYKQCRGKNQNIRSGARRQSHLDNQISYVQKTTQTPAVISASILLKLLCSGVFYETDRNCRLSL